MTTFVREPVGRLLQLFKANYADLDVCWSSILGEVIKLTDVKDFPLSLWLIFIICVGYYVAIFPFIGLGQWVLHQTHTHTHTILCLCLASVCFFRSERCTTLSGLKIKLMLAIILLCYILLYYAFNSHFISNICTDPMQHKATSLP